MHVRLLAFCSTLCLEEAKSRGETKQAGNKEEGVAPTRSHYITRHPLAPRERPLLSRAPLGITATSSFQQKELEKKTMQ